MNRFLIALLVVVPVLAIAGNKKTHTQAELGEIFERATSGAFNQDYDRRQVAEFVYGSVYPQNTPEVPEKDLARVQVHQVENDKFLIAVPDGDIELNAYALAVITKGAGGFRAWPLYDVIGFDVYTGQLTSVEEIDLGFNNFNYDPKTKLIRTFISANDDGTCITASYYSFKSNQLELRKVTRTDDCGENLAAEADRLVTASGSPLSSRQNISALPQEKQAEKPTTPPKTVVVYEKR